MAEIKIPVILDGVKSIEELAQRTLDDFSYKGKTIREWADCISNPQTNADRIRSMTDEEMEENLFSGLCYMIPSDYCKRFDLCADCVRVWLREEVTTNG